MKQNKMKKENKMKKYLNVEFGSRGEIDSIDWVEKTFDEVKSEGEKMYKDVVDEMIDNCEEDEVDSVNGYIDEFVFCNSKEGVGVEVGLNEECGVSWYDEDYVKEKLGDWSFISNEWSESDNKIFELCGSCFE